MADTPAPVLLIQFARSPVAGQVKTRMMPHLTPQQACELHCELVLWTCRRLLASGLGEVRLSVAGDSADPLFGQCRALGLGQLSQQSGVDLGQRMYRAIREGLESYAKVILVGSDCPGIDRDYLRSALRALDNVPLVLGPAGDGGYVLIGARQIRREIFQDVDWGTDRVFAQTVTQLRDRGLGWAELATLPDIDRPADLALWRGLKADDA